MILKVTIVDDNDNNVGIFNEKEMQVGKNMKVQIYSLETKKSESTSYDQPFWLSLINQYLLVDFADLVFYHLFLKMKQSYKHTRQSINY